MADLVKVTPPRDYSSEDFLSSDYETAAEDIITISEQVNYVLAPPVITDLFKTADDSITITESVNAVLGQEKYQVAPTDQITITEQVNWLLQEAPEVPANMFLSRAQRRRFGRTTIKRPPPPMRVVEEKEKPPSETPLLTTKVISKMRFRYSIADAKIWQDYEQNRQALEQISKDKAVEHSAAAKPDEIHQELIEPISAKDQTPWHKDAITVSEVKRRLFGDSAPPPNDLQQSIDNSSPVSPAAAAPPDDREQYKEEPPEIKADEQIVPTKVVSTFSARYAIKDGRLHQRLTKIGKLLAILDSIDI